jgi:hypothetical protein
VRRVGAIAADLSQAPYDARVHVQHHRRRNQPQNEYVEDPVVDVRVEEGIAEIPVGDRLAQASE